MSEIQEADKKLQQAQNQRVRIQVTLDIAQVNLSQAISVGNAAEAKRYHRQIKKLTNSLEEAAIEIEACQNMVRQITARKSLKEKQEAEKVLEAIPEPSPDEIVAKEIENAELNSPLCNELHCGLKCRLDKTQMPMVLGRTANWRWTCKGTPEKPHPEFAPRRNILLLYPYRDVFEHERFERVVKQGPSSSNEAKKLVDAQLDLARKMAPPCPDCGQKMTIDPTFKPITGLGHVEYHYVCAGKFGLFHIKSTVSFMVPLLKPGKEIQDQKERDTMTTGRFV